MIGTGPSGAAAGAVDFACKMKALVAAGGGGEGLGGGSAEARLGGLGVVAPGASVIGGEARGKAKEQTS
jgi:hypothetical protein